MSNATVYAMKEYGGSRGIAPLVLNLCIRWTRVAEIVPSCFTPRKAYSVSVEYVAQWALEPVWKLWRREKSLIFALRRNTVFHLSSQ
jgi:hypothetical protein